MKRICIYLTYDKQKIVDQYIGYMLKELKNCTDYLAVVCNEPQIVRGKEILETYADDIFYRENIGFDAGGYKDALCNYIGWDKILSFDELVLVNDSMFGPFIPMKSIFNKMDEKSVDFWGLLKHAEFRKTGFDYFPEHIQSFFFVIRSQMLHNSCFKKYWEDMPYYTSYNEVVRKYEMQFTAWFSDLGFTYDVLGDTQINDSDNLENNYAQFRRISYELIKKRNFPFLKKQQIADESLDKQTQENLLSAIDYIDKETDYNVDFIWENIIRTLNITDIQRSLHLQYIISPLKKSGRKDTLIAVVVSHENANEYVLEYLQDLGQNCDIRLLSEHAAVLRHYREKGLECELIGQSGLRRREVIEKICRYEYVCILHDTDMTSAKRSSCTNKSYFYNIWENLIKDVKHISGVLERFDLEPRLGVLMPPIPIFSEYFGEIGNGWNGRFDEVCNIADKLRLRCQLSEELPPFRISCDVWVRGSILRRIKDMDETEMSYLPYLWSYIAQDAGYYSGIVESVNYASMNEVNLQYYLQRITGQIRELYGDFTDFVEMQKKISGAALQEFCKRYSHIFIYGTGYLARKYGDLVENVEAYVLSDGQVKPEEWDGAPVKYLSEVSGDISSLEDCVVLLCMNKKNQAQVKKLLEERGIKNYLCI
ncbi:MAG: hypothetical protein HFG82_05635 [Dorea sp.]|jgi:lipopolysaccharide biosynthesis protein|nr:hypothetical protein [Dorea sp.]